MTPPPSSSSLPEARRGAHKVGWGEFRRLRSDLEEAGRAMLYQYAGIGLAFLATVRRDGGPRVHPVCPLIRGEGLFAFLVPSPKREDLGRDPRYALHSFPRDDDENAFYLTGLARMVDDAGARAELEQQFLAERAWNAVPDGFDEQQLFEFEVQSCLLTVTTGHGDPHPHHTIWSAP
jgi:hypothetical protein